MKNCQRLRTVRVCYAVVSTTNPASNCKNNNMRKIVGMRQDSSAPIVPNECRSRAKQERMDKSVMSNQCVQRVVRGVGSLVSRKVKRRIILRMEKELCILKEAEAQVMQKVVKHRSVLVVLTKPSRAIQFHHLVLQQSIP